MELKIPESLEVEHKELHEQLHRGIKRGGRVGEAAKAAADILHPHFEKEVEYTLPPLGLLSSLLSEVVAFALLHYWEEQYRYFVVSLPFIHSKIYSPISVNFTLLLRKL
jgi:hypothetical protein